MTKQRRKKKYRNGPSERHVQLHHWMLGTAAYASLPPATRVVLIEVYRLYNGYNNGRLALGVRDAAKRCNISKNTAHRAFKELVAKGFLAVQQRSSFNMKARKAVEYALSEYRNDVTQQVPSKDFVRWKPANANTLQPRELAALNDNTQSEKNPDKRKSQSQ